MVPSHSHRLNLAERAIQAWKYYFKARLASVDPNFPLTEWDYLVEQANITLNLLCTAQSNPKLLAYTYLFGKFNSLATTLDPPERNSRTCQAFSAQHTGNKWVGYVVCWPCIKSLQMCPVLFS